MVEGQGRWRPEINCHLGFLIGLVLELLAQMVLFCFQEPTEVAYYITPPFVCNKNCGPQPS